MSPPFDALKALREELSGLSEVQIALHKRQMAAEGVMAQAEDELNAIRKLRGYCELQMEEKRKQIQMLELERQ